jgi:S-adenosyl-L-methionine hydrolase (adenosine-forming)
MPNGVIAILTDFGDRDGFTGVMKGVILSIFSEARTVDIAHHIPPQDVWHASWVLDQAFDYFPAGTFFLCVVDPDVGNSNQRKLVLYSESQQKGLILPDNGLATRIIKRCSDLQCYSIEAPEWYRNQEVPSSTFHGRDIYAPVSAHLAKAYTHNQLDAVISQLGPSIPVNNLKLLNLPLPQQNQAGEILASIDICDT